MTDEYIKCLVFQRKLEERYIRREKKSNESVQGLFVIEVVDEENGVQEPLGIVISGEDIDVESEEI